MKGAGKTAESKEKSKCNKYSDLGSSYHFVPISSETFGAWGPQSRTFFKELDRQLIEHTGEKRMKFFLLQNLGICIQKGNSSSVLGSIPKGKKLEEVFLL